MSDASTRRWLRSAQQGELEARVRLLTARLRDGDLDAESARLAATLGDPAAQLALGDAATPPPLLAWIRELRDFDQGLQAGVRCAVSVAQLLLPVWDVHRPNDDRPARLVEAAGRWALAPSPERAQRARSRLTSRTEGVEELLLVFRLAGGAAEVAQSPSPDAPRRALFMASSAVSLAADLTSEVRVRRAIARTVAPWPLGDDPLPELLARGLWPAPFLERGEG